jgi:hypothetical protein
MFRAPEKEEAICALGAQVLAAIGTRLRREQDLGVFIPEWDPQDRQ